MSHRGPTEDPQQTSAISSNGEGLTFERFKLVVTTGPDAGRERVSESNELAIGTAEANQLVLTDSTVSRHHCVIAADAGAFELRDLGSTNGTFLAGFRVKLAMLKPGAVIALGKTMIRFEALGETISEPLSDQDRYGRVLGKSAGMRRLFALLPRVGASDSTVLIEGETGTGKSVIATAVHQASSRCNGPFIVVDCGAVPPTLIESFLFGHEKGAFTGAHTARAGAFESARGGTIFLDEIGELPLEMQPKLLRALESRVVTRLGSVEPVRLDVRMIAATLCDLREMVNRGTFRADLYFRLNVVRLRIPPLRERLEDIPLLVDHFYRQVAGDAATPPPEELVTAFMRLDWPGNVRELRNAVERAVLLGHLEDWADGPSAKAGASGTSAEAPSTYDFTTPFRDSKERIIETWERAYLAELMRRHAGNVSAAARTVQMDRSYLRQLLKRHSISVRDDD